MSADAGTSVRVRLGTYNLHDLHDDRAALLDVLLAMRADVVCVQEVPRHPRGLRTVRRLAAEAGLRAPRSHALGGGTSVLVGPRVDVVTLRHRPLRVPVAQRRRGVAVLDAVVDGVPVRVLSAHLGLHAVQRLRHVRQIIDIADGAPHGAAVLLAGDANEGVDGPALQLLARSFAVLGDAVPTFPAARAVSAIDVVLGRGIQAAHEVEIPVPPATLARASDHRPRVVEVDISGPGARSERPLTTRR